MFEQLMDMLKELGQDVKYEVKEEGHFVEVTIQDFDGFDDDWSEVMRDYDHPELVEQFEDWLEEKSLSQDGDFYLYYDFEGFTVKLGYSGYDI